MIILAFLMALLIAAFFIWISGSWKNEPWPHPGVNQENPYRYWE